jgi:dienelactone hydrolase
MDKTHLIILVLALITLTLAGCGESTVSPTTTPLLTKIQTATLPSDPTPLLTKTQTATLPSSSTPASTQVPPTKTPRPSPTITPTLTPIPPYETLVELFEYDHELPVDLVVESEENRDGVTVQTVKYYGAEHQAYHKALRVSAYLVLPARNGLFPAILYLHAGGMSKDQYLDEAILLAQQGVVCLVIDGPISSNRGARLDPFDVPAVRDAYIRTVIDLRRGVDVLESLPQVDPDRMAYVGHSYGATWAGVLAGIETRLRAYVLMAGYAQVSENDTPQVPELDAIRYLGYAAPAAYLFQFAENDAFIDHEEAQLYFDTANEPKTMFWYDTDHFTLQHVSQADRLSWLGEQLDFVVQ